MAILLLCFGANAASAGGPSKVPIVISQTTWLDKLPNGGALAGAIAAGVSLAVNPNGDIIISTTYGGSIVFYNHLTGKATILGSYSNAGGLAVDPAGNLYVGSQYSTTVAKVPYINGSYAPLTDATATAPSDCVGNDTTECVVAPLKTISGGFGVSSMVFDAQGNLFLGTDDQGNPHSIWECTAACLATGTPAPTMLFKEPTSSDPVGVGQLYIGGLAVDPWGNLFFTDSNLVNQATNGNKSSYSDLYELPFTSGTGFAATPTLIQKMTVANPGNYDDEIDGVAVDSNGTVYYATQYDGIFAFPNNAGVVDTANVYAVSTQGLKTLTIDGTGNFYGESYSNTTSADTLAHITVNNVTAPASAIGKAATANATILDNLGGCSTTPTLTVAASISGVSTTEFTGAVAAKCNDNTGGSNFALTLTFTPAAVGNRTAVFTTTDTANNGSTFSSVTGIGQGVIANLDPGVWSSYSGFNTPAAAVADAAGDIFIADPAAAKVYEIVKGTNTPVAVGSGFTTPTALAFDAAGNLYIADAGIPAIFRIQNTSTTGAFVAGSQKQVVTSSTTFGGNVLKSPGALAIGPDSTLYIADTGLKAVVTYSIPTQATGITLASSATGIQSPVGVAVDPEGEIFVADDKANTVFEFEAGGTIEPISSKNAPQPHGIAIDASGSLLIADKATGNIVRIPGAGGLDPAKEIVIETVPTAAGGLGMDGMGNLYVADAANQKVYAIQRTAAAVDLGTVPDGESASATIFLQNAGNLDATLGSPAITQPANSYFTITEPGNNGCTDGGTGPAGASCEFTATFAPVSPADGAQNGSATLSTNAVNSPSTITLMGNAGSVTPQKITGFNPPSPIFVGQQITLSATGGASGKPVVFSIDSASTCPSCATINGTTLTGTGIGTVIVDANQAAGTVGGINYGAAPQVQATIVINNPKPEGVPTFLMTQQSWRGVLPAGGGLAQDSGAGSSFAVNQNGEVLLSTSYGGTVVMYSPKTAKFTTLGNYGKYNNTGGVTVDAQGNLYVGALYSNIVAKVPYVNGVYAALSDATGGTAPADCAGNDTTECVVAPLKVAGIGGVSAMTLDAKGNLFLVNDDQGNNPFSIWECTAACLATGTPAPVMLFQEPKSADQAVAGQFYIGGIAVDPWGNLFFTDSLLLDQSNNKNSSAHSNLNELVYTAGTGFAATPTVIQTLTNTPPLSGYNNQLVSVAVRTDGTIVYSTLYDGIFAIPSTQAGGPSAKDGFVVAGGGGKEIALANDSNLYYVSYHSSGDSLGQILVDNLVVPTAQVNGPATTASATIVDEMFGWCGTTSTLTITSSDSQFSATADTKCTGAGAGLSSPVAASTYPATINFAATKQGPQTTMLTIADAANGGLGTASVSGVGEETPQTITFTAPTSPVTFAANLQITLAATGGASNNPVVFTVDAASTGTGTIAGNVLTVTGAGNLIIDANQAGGLVGGIFYSDAPQVQQTIVVNPAAQTITFTPPTSPVTFAAGLTVTLSATGGASNNPVVFTVDQSSTATGTISGNTLTVTSAGNLVINANQAGNTNYAAATQVQQTIVVNLGVQTITFTPPPSPVHYLPGLKITLTATGGPTANPVVFTVDASSTGTGTIAGNVLTVTGQGVIVIDANQAGDSNYNAAAQVQQSITVLPALPTQTITFNNPGTQVNGVPLTLAATASSGLTVVFSSSTTSVCTVSGTTATFVADGNCTINADQAGNDSFAAAPTVTQTFIVNPVGVIPAINLSMSLSSITLQPTDVGLTTITVMSKNSFTGAVSFACGGLPSGYSCTFNPNPITIAANQGASTNLTIKPGGSAALTPASRPLFPIATLAVALFCFGFRKRNRLQMLLLAVICAAGFGLLSACSDNSGSKKSTATTSNVTITATSGGVSQSSTLTLIVEK